VRRAVGIAPSCLAVVAAAAESSPAARRDGRIVFTRALNGPGGTLVSGRGSTPSGRTETGLRRVTDPRDGWDADPAWSPDGRQIAFTRHTRSIPSRVGDFEEIFVVDADGSHLRRLTDNHVYDGQSSWAPGGRLLAYVHDELIALLATTAGKHSQQVMVARADGRGAQRR
jgi:Tol biopolymer transport system component